MNSSEARRSSVLRRSDVIPLPEPPDLGRTARNGHGDLIAEAREEGFRAGVTSGREQERAEVQVRNALDADRVVEALNRATSGAAELRRDALAEMEGDAAALACEIACVVLGYELEGRESLRRLIAGALALAPQGPTLVVRLNPDSSVGETTVCALASTLRSHPTVDVVLDRSVDRLGCVVTAGNCHIDAQVSHAIERVRAALDELFGDGSVANAQRASVTQDSPQGSVVTSKRQVAEAS